MVEAIVTSGVVAAVVSAVFKWWSEIDQSRRGFLSGVLTEAFKREAKAYEDVWAKMYALQEACAHCLFVYSSKRVDPTSSEDLKELGDDVKKASDTVVSTSVDLLKVMDQNRPFFHRDVYLALREFGDFARSDYFMRIQFPALHGLGSGTQPPKPIDYEEWDKELGHRIDQVSSQIRARMTRPQEAYVSSWLVSHGWSGKNLSANEGAAKKEKPTG